MPCQMSDDERRYCQDRERRSQLREKLERFITKEFGENAPFRSQTDDGLLNVLTARLCALCELTPDIRTKSLELQHWWLGHQLADREREQRKIARLLEEKERQKKRDAVKEALEKIGASQEDIRRAMDAI